MDSFFKSQVVHQSMTQTPLVWTRMKFLDNSLHVSDYWLIDFWLIDRSSWKKKFGSVKLEKWKIWKWTAFSNLKLFTNQWLRLHLFGHVWSSSFHDNWALLPHCARSIRVTYQTFLYCVHGFAKPSMVCFLFFAFAPVWKITNWLLDCFLRCFFYTMISRRRLCIPLRLTPWSGFGTTTTASTFSPAWHV